MLAAPSSSPHYNIFQPSHSSLLARDARRTATFNLAMNSANATNTNDREGSQQSRATQRQNPKTAPKLSTERLGTERRGAFLRKVREGREDRRWEFRGEDMMRADFLNRQRAWEAAQARDAPPEKEVYYEEDYEDWQLPTEAMDLSTSQAHPDDEVEDFLRDEDQELEALLEFMPAGNEGGMKDDGDSLWSDDADYEALFEQVLSQQEQQHAQFESIGQRLGGNAEVDETGEEMDMN